MVLSVEGEFWGCLWKQEAGKEACPVIKNLYGLGGRYRCFGSITRANVAPLNGFS